ncbi:hypothetical protein M9458_008005, partial [Cirrhinus mrigala]
MSAICLSPDDPVIRILLMGRYGSGQSSSGNTIVGEKKFEVRKYETKISGKQVHVFICPDPLDPDLNEEQLEEMEDVPLTVPLLQPVQNEEEMLDNIKGLCGPEVQNYTMILFTCVDELEELDQTIHEYLQMKMPSS